MNELRTSEEWSKGSDYIVLDPDGWDRKNYQYSWFEELITIQEFNRRLGCSTVKGKSRKNLSNEEKNNLASIVKNISGFGFVSCKQAIIESGGNIDEAVKYLKDNHGVPNKDNFKL